MKTSTIKLLALEFVLILLLLLNVFVINIKNIYILSIVLLLFLGISIFLLGYEKNRQRFKKDIVLNIIIYTFVFQIILYLSGIFLGFVRNGYSLSFINIIRNTLPVILIIVISEFLRYSINVKGQKQKYILALSVLVFVLIDISLQIHLYQLQDKKEVFELFAYIILPSISKNILLTYFSFKFGWGSTILYRILMEIPVYLMPIFPDLNIYLNSVISFLFPFILLYSIYRSFKPIEEKIDVRKKKVISRIIAVVSIIFFVIVVALTSGVFPIYALVIGSESMEPNINKGDVAIILKLNEKEFSKLNKEDILVFQYDNTVIVHRIVEIHEVNGNFTFKTKGDNNETVDPWIIDQKKVIGKVVSRVPFVGYPTVWLNEALN